MPARKKRSGQGKSRRTGNARPSPPPQAEPQAQAAPAETVMGLRERMAAAWHRAGQTAREETRFDLSMRRVREMPQSEKTGRIRRGVIAGMLATAGAMFFRPKIPFLADAERRADVSMLFGPHIRAGDVRPII